MFDKLAKVMVTGVPTAQLSDVVSRFDRSGTSRVASEGGICGAGCDGTDGYACGLGCSGVGTTTVGVVDPSNRAGISRTEINDARANLSGFADAIRIQARDLGISLR